MKKIIYTILIFLTLSGCASSGEKFTELESVEDDQSIIYVMRPWRLYRGIAILDVLINEEKVADLVNGGYIPVKVSPGSGILTISASLAARTNGWRNDPINLKYEIKPKETKFIMLDAPTNYILPVGAYHIVSVNIDLFELKQEEAMKFLPKLSYSKIKKRNKS